LGARKVKDKLGSDKKKDRLGSEKKKRSQAGAWEREK